ESAWSDDGSMLAMVIDVDGKSGNGIQLLNTRSGVVKSLDAADRTYSGLQWRAHSDDFAAMRSRADSAYADTSYTVIAWRGLSSTASKTSYEFAADKSFPANQRVAAHRTLPVSGVRHIT